MTETSKPSGERGWLKDVLDEASREMASLPDWLREKQPSGEQAEAERNFAREAVRLIVMNVWGYNYDKLGEIPDNTLHLLTEAHLADVEELVAQCTAELERQLEEAIQDSRNMSQSVTRLQLQLAEAQAQVAAVVERVLEILHADDYDDDEYTHQFEQWPHLEQAIRAISPTDALVQRVEATIETRDGDWLCELSDALFEADLEIALGMNGKDVKGAAQKIAQRIKELVAQREQAARLAEIDNALHIVQLEMNREDDERVGIVNKLQARREIRNQLQKRRRELEGQVSERDLSTHAVGAGG